MSFEANIGQADRRVKFFARGSGYGLYLTGEEAVLALHGSGCDRLPAAVGRHAEWAAWQAMFRMSEAACAHQTAVVRLRLAGASRAAPAGEQVLPGTANYIIGNDPGRWHTGLVTYARVRYHNVYPGVDLVYYGNQRQLEYDFAIAPGANPAAIRLMFSGSKRLRLGADGDLMVTAAGGTMAFRRPMVYQVSDGQRKPVLGRFTLLARHTVGFRLGSYDRSKKLVIDPVLVYSTYLGGNEQDYATAIAVDAEGDAYVAGYASSTDFPVTQGAFQIQRQNNGCGIPFVAKLNPAGSALLYSTYLSGTSKCSDFAYALAVDSSGNVYVAGLTGSRDFPVTPGAFQTTSPYSSTGFVTKLNPTGNALIYSTFLGGTDAEDSVSSLVVDGSGNAYIAGTARSTDFPVTPGAYQTTNHIVPSPVYGNIGGTNAFVAKLNATGSALLYSTYLGGSGIMLNNGTEIYGDGAGGLAVDSGGNAYVAGAASSTDFPVTLGAFQTTNNAAYNSGYNAFVTKINPAGTALVYSTYFGGSSTFYKYGVGAAGIAVDGPGNAYITGSASYTDVPVTPGAFQSTNDAAANPFIAKLNPTGTALVYCTYLGGSLYYGTAAAIAVDVSGNAYITGLTQSSSFPVTPGAFQPSNATKSNGPNAFVSELNATGTALVYSTYIGGGGQVYPSAGDSASALALDGSGDVYIVGKTQSTDFPVTQGAFQMTYSTNGVSNAFVTKLNLSAVQPTNFPAITAVTNGASFQSGVVPGSWMTIFGTNLSPVMDTWGNAIVNGKLPTSLDGVSVNVGGQPAYIAYVSPTQINAIAPAVETGTISVTVSTPSGTSPPVAAVVRVEDPAFFQWGNYVVATHQDFSPAAKNGTLPEVTTVPAKPGDIIILWGTGFGPTSPAAPVGAEVPAGRVYYASETVTVTVGAVPATVYVTALSPGFAGLYQVAIQVPTSLTSGDYPVVATVGGAQSPSSTLITVLE